MESWQKILGIIEFIIALVVLLFLIGVIVVITKFRNIEFNEYWKSRTLLASSAFVWVIFLMLGNEYLWSSTGDGLFNMKESHSAAICGLHVFFTVGFAEPLFFLICLFTIKSKTNKDKDNNGNSKLLFLKFKDSNNYVYLWSLVSTLPLTIIHIILLILDATNVNEPKDKQLLFTVFDKTEKKCAVPIISTAAFAIFFIIFLLFFIYFSRKFSKTIINRSLINRIRLLQISFIAFLPLEVAIRVVLIFTLKIGYTSQALFNAFFFVDIIVILIGVLEFALFPILDSLGFYSSSIRLWRFKFMMSGSQLNDIENNNDEFVTDIGDDTTTTTAGNGKDKFTFTENDGAQNIPLKTLSTNISTTPNSLIPISDYEKTMKNNNSNGAGTGYESNDNGTGQTSYKQQTELEKLNIKHKSPILERVYKTDPINVPLQPLSTPLSSVSSKSSHLESTVSNHERKKSRRFSLSSKKRSSSNVSSASSQSPISQSPPHSSLQSNNNNRYVQPTPVDDFKGQLFKYSNQPYK